MSAWTVLAAGDFFSSLTNFANLSNHLTLIGIYVILALSLNLINGFLGAFSLGHHGFWGMGAYAAGIVVWYWGGPHGSALAFFFSFVAAVGAAALFGLLVGAPCLRLRGDYLAIATLGFAEIFIICARNSESWTTFGPRGLGGAAGFSIGDGHHVTGDELSGNDFVLSLVGTNERRQIFYLLLVWVLAAFTYILIRNLIRSGHGRAIQAIRDDETAAELMGVKLIRYKVMVFVIGAGLAGMAGALAANFRSEISPTRFAMMEGIKILLMVVLGGLGSMSGTVLAVFVLYGTEQALNTFSVRVPYPGFSGGEFVLRYVALGDLWQVLFALVLIVLMLRWPNGLTGGHELSGEALDALRQYIRGKLRVWRLAPLAPLIRIFQWGQLLALLPASETLSASNSIRLAIIGSSLAVFFLCGWAARAYERSHQNAILARGTLA